MERNSAALLLAIALVKTVAIGVLLAAPKHLPRGAAAAIRILGSNPGALPILIAVGMLLWLDSIRTKRLRLGGESSTARLLLVLAFAVALTGLAVYLRYF